jgi:undecaprenyl-diphosphatase
MKNLLWKWFRQMDQKILDLIQQKLYNPKCASVMDFISHPPYLRQIALVIILATFIIGTPQIRWQTGFLLLAIILSDQTCNLVKALVKRVRPDGDRPMDGSFWQKLGHYSFPSSHTANTFCVAVLALHWWPYLGIFFYILALIVAFSRVYLKNHYPSDVLVGGLIGASYGILFIKLIP